jgi:hypothetical protein
MCRGKSISNIPRKSVLESHSAPDKSKSRRKFAKQIAGEKPGNNYGIQRTPGERAGNRIPFADRKSVDK